MAISRPRWGWKNLKSICALAPFFSRYRIFKKVFRSTQDVKQNRNAEFWSETLPVSRTQVDQSLHKISEFFNVILVRYVRLKILMFFTISVKEHSYFKRIHISWRLRSKILVFCTKTSLFEFWIQVKFQIKTRHYDFARHLECYQKLFLKIRYLEEKGARAQILFRFFQPHRGLLMAKDGV